MSITKRLRIFAGPNGSGKSSIITKILSTEVQKGVTLDFGIYINADDIAAKLRTKGCDFKVYKLDVSENDFFELCSNSGLLNAEFTEERFKNCVQFNKNRLTVLKEQTFKINDNAYERIAQIIADFLRNKLLTEGVKFSFETVFSHEGKVEFIRRAKEAGYKVYLYFVSTEHPRINVYRVKKVRVPNTGHDVDEDKIISRYYRSMDLLYDASQYCYQAYFFDNSVEGGSHTMFAHFKQSTEGEKTWDDLDKTSYPQWFKKYYSGKIKENQ